jgi:hypothetical protein
MMGSQFVYGCNLIKDKKIAYMLLFIYKNTPNIT